MHSYTVCIRIPYTVSPTPYTVISPTVEPYTVSPIVETLHINSTLLYSLQ